MEKPLSDPFDSWLAVERRDTGAGNSYSITENANRIRKINWKMVNKYAAIVGE